MDLPPAVHEQLVAQHGLIRRRDLLMAGVSEGTVRWQLGRGWRLVLPGVVATFTGALTPVQRVVAGQLLVGDRGVVSGTTAAAWHGVLAAAGQRVVHLQVPAQLRARRHAFVVVTRTIRPDPAAWSRPPVQIASPARAVVDAARQARRESMCRAVILEAVQRRIVRLVDLRHEVEAGSVRGAARLRGALGEAEAGVWSIPESDLLQVLSRSRALPEVTANPSLFSLGGERLPTPDAWVDEVGLAIQVHSRRFHAGIPEWDATVMADGRFAEHGIVVLAVTPAWLDADPAAVLLRVERTYRALRGRPRPPVRMGNPVMHVAR